MKYLALFQFTKSVKKFSFLLDPNVVLLFLFCQGTKT